MQVPRETLPGAGPEPARSDGSVAAGQWRSWACALAGAAADRARQVFAESFCNWAVQIYWGLRCPNGEFPIPACSRSHPPLDRQALDGAMRLGSALASLPPVEACHQIGLTYASLLPPEERARQGVFYTPPPLVDRLLDQAEAAGLEWRTARLLDPACGGGAFLVAAALRLVRALGASDPAIILQSLTHRLCGWELDPFAAWLAQVFVEAAVLPQMRAAGRRPGSVVAVRDSLAAADHPERFDLVMGNPPFGRITLAPPDRERFQRSLYGHANLYALFMDLSIGLLRPGGLLAFLTPASFLAGEYFKNLRALLWREAPPVNVDFVDARKGVFEGVLQETVLATYRRGGRGEPAAVHVIRDRQHQQRTGLEVVPTGSFSLPADPQHPWVVSRRVGEEGLAARLRAMPDRLADWGYRVSTGPLVWNRHKGQIHDRPGPGRIALVWAESVTGDGRFVFRCEKRNHKPFFRPDLPDDEWLIVRVPCVLVQRTTAKEQSRRLIAAEMPAAFVRAHGGVTVENHLNMLLATGSRPAVSPAVLAAFLNSRAADRAFRCLSGSVAVSAYELEALPLPPAHALAPVAKLVGSGAVRAEVDAACATLYGLHV